MSLYPLQIFSRSKDSHQDVPLYDFPEEDGIEIHHAERTLHLSCDAIKSLSLSPYSPVKCCINGLTHNDKKLPSSPYFILFIMNSPKDLPSNYAFINRRVITSHVPEYLMIKNVLHSDVSKAKISLEDVPCFSPAKMIAFTVFDVHEKDRAVYSMKLSMRHRIKDSFPLTSPFLFQSGEKFKTKFGYHDYVMEVASVSRNEDEPYFCLKEHVIINKEDRKLKSYSRSEKYSDSSQVYYFVDNETRVEFSFPSSIQPEKQEFPFCDYCPYTDGIVRRLSSNIVEIMNNKSKFDKDSYGRGGCGMIVSGERNSLKREIVTKSVKEAKFSLIERDIRIPMDDNWLISLVTKARLKSPSVILVSCGEVFFSEHNAYGREAVTFISEELQYSEEEVLLIVTSEEPHNVSVKLHKIFASSFYVHPPDRSERSAIVRKILEEKEKMKETPNRISNVVVGKIADKTRKLSVRQMCSAVLKEYYEILKQDNGNIRQKTSSNKSEVSWDSIQGYSAIKSSIKLTIEQYLRDPEKHSFEGLLLFGPPGCSKTLFVRTLVAESGFSLVNVQGSDYMSMYVGETEKNLRALFQTALSRAPSILFIDELDSLCQARNKTESHGDLISEIKELMSQCVSNGIQRVFLIGATNRPSLIDESLLKKGFFSRVVHIDLPSCEDRCAIWQHKIDNCPTRGTMDAKALCEASKGFSGAEIHASYTSAVMKMKRMRYEPALNAHLKSLGLPLIMAGRVKQPQSVIDCIYVTQEEILQTTEGVLPTTDLRLLKESRDFSTKYSQLHFVKKNC